MALRPVALILSAGAGLLLTGCDSDGSGLSSSTSPSVTTVATSTAATTAVTSTNVTTAATTTTSVASTTLSTVTTTTSTTTSTVSTTTTLKTTTSTTTTSTTTTSTTANPSGLPVYCPAARDLAVAYGNQVQLKAQGWTVWGGGGASTKASFNLAGGFVEFDLDVSQAKTGVIPNVYSIFPAHFAATGFKHSHYCDASEGAATWCVEHDWIESNGNCGGNTALHSKRGTGPDGCNSWGCLTSYKYHSGSKFRMRIEYDKGGRFTVVRDGELVDNYEPAPTAADFEILRAQHEQRGAVVYSSMWTGSWVPCEGCGRGPGDVAGSRFSVSNLRISGAVVQGPTPARCPELALNESEFISV